MIRLMLGSLMRVSFVGLLFVASTLTAKMDFRRDVRPILSENCFHCHGPDASTRMAGLRLDTRDGLLAGTAAGPVIVPGDPAGSRLFARVSAEMPARRMPPPYAKRTLSEEQIATLRQWIAEGAAWEDHWAFETPTKQPLPDVKLRDWPRNEIDRFVLARLESSGIQPAQEADRNTLIRRVSLALTGLPPSPAEVAAFVADLSPNAYEKLVDRLLASPDWGEHRARFWLDSARYADTHGLHADNYREIWPYRDWVINAFNRNLSFDRFTREQLAGDLFPDPTLDQLIATGFHRNNITTNEGGVIPEEAEALYARDRVETTAAVWLGLTLGCAACHDHKYDPLTQKEFYRFAAFFMNTTQPALDGNIPLAAPVLVIPERADRARFDKLSASIQELRVRVREALAASEAAFNAWLERAGYWEVPSPLEQRGLALHLESVDLGERGPIEVPDVSFRSGQPFSFSARMQIPEKTETILASYVGRSGNGPRWVLAAREMFLHFALHDPSTGTTIGSQGRSARLPPGGWQHVAVTYDGSGRDDGITLYANGMPLAPAPADDLSEHWRAPHFETTRLRLGGDGVRDSKEGAIRQVLVDNAELESEEIRILGAWIPFLESIEKDPSGAKLSAGDRESLHRFYLRETDPAFRELTGEMQIIEKEMRPIQRRGQTTLVMREKPDTAPVARVLERGQYDQPGETVTPGVPAIAGSLPNGVPANRLALADWLVSPENPLTARVIVNRFWQEVFGVGLVETAHDFGAAGEPPSHPELLDWLAVDFRESGWDVKRLFRSLVSSAAFRQSAAATPEKLGIDPANRLLARGPRFRMDAETLRDAALAASGLLARNIGGPSVKPYQPEGVWQAVAVLFSNTRFYKPDQGSKLYRRSLYTFWKRSAPPASMQIFNAPTREVCQVRRERTNTPLQALVTMNDPQFVEAARFLAERAITQPDGRFDARLDFITRHLLARDANTGERSVFRQTHEKLLAHYQREVGAAKRLIGVGETPPNSKIPPPELAAWTMVASIVLNLDEALNQ